MDTLKAFGQWYWQAFLDMHPIARIFLVSIIVGALIAGFTTGSWLTW